MKTKFSILVVDDDPLLLEILNRASQTTFPEASFVQLYSSPEAKKYIKDLSGYGPKLVLLDLDLQDTENGLDFLVFLRGNDKTRILPVVILTSSKLTDDIRSSYSFGASSFTIKPFSYSDWKTYFIQLRLYWLETVTIPKIIYYPAE